MKRASLQATALILITALGVATGVISSNLLSTNLLAQNLFNSETAQNLQREQDDARRFEENKKNEVRHLTDRTRECKDMSRQVKQGQKNGSKSAQELAQRVTAFCAAVEKGKRQLQSISSQEDLDTLREDIINPEISDIAQDLWEGLNGLNAQSDVFRGLKENKNTCKNFARSMKDVTRRAKQAKIDVTALLIEGNNKVTECDTNYKQLGEYAKSELWEEARELLQDYFWDNTLHEDFNQIREAIEACSDIGRIVSEAERGTKQIDKALKQFKAKKLDITSAENTFRDALGVVAEARDLAKAGSCDRNSIDELKGRLEEAGQTLESELEDLKIQASGSQKRKNSSFENSESEGDDFRRY
jgi:hypothetical protein